jgi:kinesin family protein C2/C3
MFLRGNLRVMCRLRPFISSEIINNKLPDLIKINNDSILINENGNLKSFEFDYIFNKNSTQQNVYEECSLLIQSMFSGNNICIIAYGQTCTGKTYTIQGPDNNNPGIVINAAKEIFDLISKNNNVNVRLTLTIIEIYKEQIFNLLDENLPNLNIYESNGNLMIPDLMPVSINNLDEAQKLFNLASKFRHIGNNDFNERSSRSHCIFTFKLKITNNNNKITRSTLNIIDLAGSERISKSNLKDENIKKEAININLSLHALSTVLNSIANKASHIPYRDSKLTHYLKESLNENYNILLILHISPNIKDLPESISTLQFGTRIVKICKHKTGKDKIQLINGKEK